MKSILARLAALLEREPVRAYIYTGVVVPLVAVLVARGILDDSATAFILSVVAILLGVPAVEAARGKVTPVSKPGAQPPAAEPMPLDQ